MSYQNCISDSLQKGQQALSSRKAFETEISSASFEMFSLLCNLVLNAGKLPQAAGESGLTIFLESINNV